MQTRNGGMYRIRFAFALAGERAHLEKEPPDEQSGSLSPRTKYFITQS